MNSLGILKGHGISHDSTKIAQYSSVASKRLTCDCSSDIDN